MGKISNLKKIQIILIALIVILGIIFTVLTIKIKNKKNYSTRQTVSQIEDTMQLDSNEETNTNSNEILIEMEEEKEGDVIEENPEDTSWDDKDAKDTKVDIEKEKEKEKNKEKNSGNKYYIKINYTANVVTIYTKDSDGNYTIPVKAIVCSTGKATPTSGVYKMSNKYRWHQLNGGVYGQYCSRITGHILFHSVPYAKNTPDSLKYVAYDKLGTKASAGCIRLTCQDAMWIYNNCPSGTYVEFYSSGNPGPLGKPSAQKISSNEQCRNWDPTDPTKGNPWHSYTASAPTTNVESTKSTQAEPKKEEIIKQEEKKEEKENKKNEVTNNVVNTTTNSNATNTSSSKENESKNTVNTNVNTNASNNTNSNSTLEKEVKNTSTTNTNSSDEKIENSSKKNEE